MPDDPNPVTAQPVNGLPANATQENLKRIQWAAYAKTLKAGGKLSKTEWERMLQLTQELSKDPTAKDVDWFKEAEEAKAFSGNHVPRCTPQETTLRVQQVAEWIIEGQPSGFILSEARHRWGVGHDSVRILRKRAQEIIEKYGEQRKNSMFGTTIRRIDNLYRKGDATGNLQAVAQSIDHMIKIGGLASPVKQVMEFSGPNGGPIAQLVVPERGKLDRDA